MDGRRAESLEAVLTAADDRHTRIPSHGWWRDDEFHTRREPHDRVPALEAQRVVQVYRRAPIVVTHGRGVYLYDSDGREYLDLISGVGVASLGHANPELARDRRRTGAGAAALLEPVLPSVPGTAGGAARDRCRGSIATFFCNSGTEGMEACLKFARRYWYTAGETRRTRIVALEGAFHGRTMGSLSVTGDPHYRDPFAPLLPGRHVRPANDTAGLQRGDHRPTRPPWCSKPIQGEGGVRPLTAAFAGGVQEACDRTGALLICDEVQCGLGRTGHPFYYPVLGLRPQLVAVGKALGAGIPIGAALVADDVAARLDFGDHGSTYGGNLLACRAGLFFVGQLLEGGLLDHVARVGRAPGDAAVASSRAPPMVREVRGRGPDARPRPRSARGAGGGRGARARPARERHGADRRAHAAAADDHGDRDRPGDRSARRRAGRGRWSAAMTFATVPLTAQATHPAVHRASAPASGGAASGHGRRRRGHSPADCGPRSHRTTCCRGREDEIASRIARFVVGEADGAVVACAELAPLSAAVAEVRSLVVAEHVRGMGVGRLILDALVRHAVANGHQRLCAFTHGPAYFIRLGFSIVPHLWVPEKVFTDCVGCPLFRTCGQHAVVLALDERQLRLTTMRLGNGTRGARRVTIQPMPGGITAARGFRAAGVSAGIKASGALDVALIVPDAPAPRRPLFTTNQVQAAPVTVSREHLAALRRTRGRGARQQRLRERLHRRRRPARRARVGARARGAHRLRAASRCWSHRPA